MKNYKNKVLLFFPYLLIMYEVVLYLSNDMYLPSMPAIATDLMLSDNEIQTTLTFWFLGASALQVILGPLSDRFGRRIIILCGAVCFLVASAFCALATSLTTLLIARLIQGAAVCTLVAGYAAVNESFATKQAIKLFAIIGAITILAPALGPLFGALVLEFANWRVIFWILAYLSLFILIAMYAYLPETNVKRSKLKFFNIVQDYGKILTNRDFLIPCICYCLLVAIEFLWAFESPFIMIETYKESTLFYGIAQSLIFGCFLIGAIATKWLLDLYSIKTLIKTGMTATIIGIIALWVCAIMYPSIILGIACMMLIALGSSLLIAPLTRIALESCPQPTGMVTAVFTSAANLAGATMGVVVSFIEYSSLFSIATVSIICIAFTIALILYLRMPIAKRNKFKSLFYTA